MIGDKFTFLIDTKKRIVSEFILGEWSELTAYEYSMYYVEEIAMQFRGDVWVKKVDLNMWVPNQKIVNLIGRHLKWVHNHGGMAFSANICFDKTKREILQKMFIAGGINAISEIFRNAENADAWLKKRGF